MAVKNAQLMSQLWLQGSNSYQQRISSPSVATTAQQIRELWDPANLNFRNEFIDGLLNRVGLSYVRQHSWRNPLDVFKKRRLEYGSTVLEAQAKLLVGRTYDDSRETLLKVHRPEIAQCIHQLDYFMQYPYTVNHMELRRAAEGESGLNEFVAAIMDSAMTSAQWDEYKSMVQLLAWYDSELGMYKKSLSAPTDEATSKAFLQSIREYAGLLQFPSGKYMAQVEEIQGAGLTTWANPEDLVIFTTPGVKAAIDVQALAGAFNLPMAEIEQRIVLLDEMPMPDVYAIMTTTDFYQVYDQAIENGSFYNPETLNSNYYLTITAIHSVSPFVPVIAFTTGAGTDDATIVQTVGTNQVIPEAYVRNAAGNLEALTVGTPLTKADVDRGVYLFGQLDGTLALGDVSGADEIDGVFVRPNAYTVESYTLAGIGGTAPRRNSRTYLDANGRLHVQAAGYRVPGGMTITVELESAYRNPSGETPTPQRTSYVFTIAGPSGDSPEPEPGPGPVPVVGNYTLQLIREDAVMPYYETQLSVGGTNASSATLEVFPASITILNQDATAALASATGSITYGASDTASITFELSSGQLQGTVGAPSETPASGSTGAIDIEITDADGITTTAALSITLT